ncbi:MAG: prkC [Firmicutes bacterium]|nr:prkC [Bacillota bacterium]
MLINRTLDHRYTILECIGGGGMADVYRAHDKLLDRPVAVKILHAQFTHDEEFVSRFRREAQAAARLSHPNIVNIYDVGQDGDIYYIVMELISGETLKEKIAREAPLPVDAAVRIALEIADALGNAHSNNIVHCDIKPHNILLTQSGRVKVTDFGIARAVTSATITQTGLIVGSVHYFSPEQAKGSVIGAKSDIYSLGIVLYEMLTGTVPFTGETSISIAIKHLQEEPQLPREINPSIPPLVEAVVLKAIAKDPEHRFLDIAEMSKDLHLAQNYFRDDQTRRLTREDFPTQILPKLPIQETEEAKGKVAVGENKDKTPMTKQKQILGIIALLLIGFIFGAFLSFGKFWSSNEVVVPDVVGKQVDDAKTMLVSQNLRVSIASTYHDKVPAGRVISQTPEAGSQVKEQRTITLTVSKGIEAINVPDLKGMSRRDAELQLKNSGLLLGTVSEQFIADIPAGMVGGQTPKPGSQVNKGSVVDIVLSKGTGPRKIAMPDLRGVSQTALAGQLDNLKLKIGTITEAPSDRYSPGTVSAQNPAPGTEVQEGSAVDFTVAKGSTATVRRASVQFVVPDGPQRQSIQIVVTDANGRRIVYEGVHKPGEKIDKSLEGAGQLRIQIYANGTLFQDQVL